MTKTLELTPKNQWQLDQIWSLLDELAGTYGDNGYDPDGNGWLPSIEISRDEATEIVQAKLGRMVNALYLNDDEIAKTLRIRDVLALAEETDDWEAFQGAVEDRVRVWAHYGAYGAGDSLWVIVR